MAVPTDLFAELPWWIAAGAAASGIWSWRRTERTLGRAIRAIRRQGIDRRSRTGDLRVAQGYRLDLLTSAIAWGAGAGALAWAGTTLFLRSAGWAE